jgi:hypothetical protein
MAAEAAVAMGDSDCDNHALRLKRQQSRFKTWFAAMWQVYRKASCLFAMQVCGLAPYVEAPCPADLEHAIVNYPMVAQSFEEGECHGIILIYMALKQGPARDLFFAEWKACMTSMGMKGCHGPPGSDRWLAKLFDLLVVTASNMEGVDMQIWSDNTNRGVGYHSGWLPFLQHLNVIRKVRAPRPAGRPRRANGSKTVKTGKTIEFTRKIKAGHCSKTVMTGKGTKTVKTGNARVKAGVAKLGKPGRGVKHDCCVNCSLVTYRVRVVISKAGLCSVYTAVFSSAGQC